MNEENYSQMTQEELTLRNFAAEKAFRDNDIDSAIAIVAEMIKRYPVLFKFYRPRQHSIQAILNSKIFMCRPSSYEDIGDNEYLPDLISIIKYYVEQVREEPIPLFFKNSEFYYEIAKLLDSEPKFQHYKKIIKDDFLTACITENFDKKMWEDYAQNGEGFCAVFDTNQIIIESQKLGYFFYPVRYVNNRKECKDIQFTADEYAESEQSYRSYVRKAFLSCLTKDLFPYSSEKEWRLMRQKPEDVLCQENGKEFPFIKPIMIVVGEYIGKNPDIEESLINVANHLNVPLIKSENYKI